MSHRITRTFCTFCKKVQSINTNKFPLFFVPLCLCVMLLFTCSLSDIASPELSDNIGYITLSVKNEKIRAIMPDDTIDSVMAYKLEINSTPPVNLSFTAEQLSKQLIPLDAGTYTLELTGYYDFDWDDEPGGTLAALHTPFVYAEQSITINPGAGQNIEVTLKPFPFKAGDEGNFIWRLDIDPDLTLTEATIKIYEFTDTAYTTPVFQDDLISPANYGNTNPIPVGYYTVVVSLTKDTNTVPVIWEQPLHIYHNMYSFFSYTFTDDFFAANDVPFQDGSENNPWLIYTETDLRAVGKGGTTGYETGNYEEWTLDSHYKLMADIDLTEKPDWEPIGSFEEVKPFTGTFNGNGRTIKGLTINSNEDGQGFFGYIEGKVENLGLIESNIIGASIVGGIAAYNEGGEIKNCFNVGNITGNGSDGNIGGIVGWNDGIVSNCYNIGNVTGIDYVGGIAGDNDSSGEISNCISFGISVTAESNVGRITGSNNAGLLANNIARDDMFYIKGSTGVKTKIFPILNANENGKDGEPIVLGGSGCTYNSVFNNFDIATETATSNSAWVYPSAVLSPSSQILQEGSPLPMLRRTSGNASNEIPVPHPTVPVQTNTNIILINNLSDTAGSASDVTFRYALTNALDGNIITFSGITPGVSEIKLASALPQITKSITIEGNGVTLTRDSSWTTSLSQLMYINNPALNPVAVVKISRIHFKDGRLTDYCAALRAAYVDLTLESCIFSGNQTTNTAPYGGAIYISGSNSISRIVGCTFYNNIAGTNGYGGAIFLASDTELYLTGNLFYENKAGVNRWSILARGTGGGNGTVNASYNVVDVPFGTENNQTGWDAGTGDTQITTVPISTTTFKLTPGSGAAGKVLSRPANYPTVDFYGDTIPATNAAAGAVQSVEEGSGSTSIFFEDFEDTTHKFTIVNGSQPNQWWVGTATANGPGRSAYISNNSGTSNAYTITSTSTVHMYSDITFPASSDPYLLTFDWKCQGEAVSLTTISDYLQVFLISTSATITAGTQHSDKYRIGANSYNTGGATTWNTADIIIPAYSAETTMRLVFSWRNDATDGTQPPAAIDNIEIIKNFPYSIIASEDFEGTNSFTIVNGVETNQWWVGTATANGGTKSVYISNDSGTSNSYTFTDKIPGNAVHIYRDITFPASSNPYYLIFDWKCEGEGAGGTLYDYLRVYLLSTDTTPDVGTLPPSANRIGANGYNLGGADTWNTANVHIPAYSSPTTMRLVFSWWNDNSGGWIPPAAIDNIVIYTKTD